MKVLKPETIPFPNSGQFIRNSTATYIEDGILKTAAINEPRWQDGKLLLEGAVTNLLIDSTRIDLWDNSYIVFSSATGPDGFSGTYRTTATTSDPTISKEVFVESGKTYTFSAWFRGVGSTVGKSAWMFPWYIGTATGEGIWLSLTLTSEWQRSSTSFTPATSGTIRVRIDPVDFPIVSVGDQVDVAFPQLETGSLTSYIPTITTAVTRQADICIGNFSRASTATYIDNNGVLQTAGINEPRIQDGRLLLEGEATNLLNSSSEFSDVAWGKTVTVTANTVVAPDGSASADTLEDTSTGDLQDVSRIVNIGVGAHTFSVWLRSISPCTSRIAIRDGGGVITFKDVLVTAEWQRFSVSSSNSASPAGAGAVWIYVRATNSETGVLYAWGSQLEQSSAATSYIPTTTAPVTRAADIHSAGLVYTTATEVRPLWSSVTTYSVGQIIRYNNNVYESLQTSNLNKQPDISPTWWLSLGADNISATFDGKVGSKTTATDKLRMIVYPGNVVDAVGYLETNAVVVNTSAVDSYGNIAYSNSTGFTESTIENWYDYFFVSPLADPATQVVHQGIPSLDPGLFVGIEMIRPGTVEVGSVLMGYSTTIGKTQYGVKAGIVDYSKKESDEFGNVSIVERPYSKRMQGDVYVNNYDLNKVQRFLYNIRATPVLWMASDNPELAEVSYVYGFYKDFSTTIAYPDVSMCNLDIEGLI